MRPRLLLVLSVFALIAGSRSARAQFTGASPSGFGGLNVSTQSSNSANGDTPGVKVSDSFYLHVGLAIGGGVDSNIFYTDTGATSAAVTHIMPQLSLTNTTRGIAPENRFELILNADYRQYYSDIQAVKDEGSAFGIGASANLDIGKDEAVTGSLFNSFTRDVQASYVPGSTEFSRDVETVGGRLRLRPGGGRLGFELTDAFSYDHFEEQQLSDADSLQNLADLRIAFKFLPKTALYIDYNQGVIHYLNNNVGKFDSKPMRLLAGLTGLITTKLTANIGVGYGNGFYDAGPSPSEFIAGADIGLIIGPFARAKVGYTHGFENSLYGNFYDLEAVYANWTQQVGGSFTAGLTGRYEHRNYHCAPGTTTTPLTCFQDPTTMQDRIDNWVSLMIDAHYFPRPWFSAGVSYILLANGSDFLLPDAMGTPTTKVSFVKHQVLAIISMTY